MILPAIILVIYALLVRNVWKQTTGREVQPRLYKK
jgi:hypothetical protein